MDKIKRFIDIYVPVTTCTLRCHYCYITQHRLFDGPLPKFRYSPEYVRKALSKDRLGGTCLLNLCGGGETLLAPMVVDYVQELLKEGHYVMIVTNATVTKRFEEMAKFPKELLSHLFFKFSYHYLELKKKNLLDQFFRNVCMMREAGASFTLEATPNDEMIPYIEEMQQAAIDHVGAMNHITIGRDERKPGKLPILTNMSKEEYKNTWSSFKSEFFDYKMTIFGQKRKEFCYAGAWSMYLNLLTGEATQCYCSYFSQNIFENLNKPIKWRPVGNNCNQIHCYNGHAFLVLGLIPELKAPTYGEIRNRKCADGSEWLKPEMRAFMDTKLYESNKQLDWIERQYCNMAVRVGKARILFEKIKRKLK